MAGTPSSDRPRLDVSTPLLWERILLLGIAGVWAWAAAESTGNDDPWFAALVTGGVVAATAFALDKIVLIHRVLAFMRRRWFIWVIVLLGLAAAVVLGYYTTRNPLAFSPTAPPATLSSSGGRAEGMLGSYCWHGRDLNSVEKVLSGWTTRVCADGPHRYPPEALVLTAGEPLEFRVDYDSPPSQVTVLDVTPPDENGDVLVSDSNNGKRQIPLNLNLGEGEYILLFSTRWLKDGYTDAHASYYFKVSVLA